jgi:hypothetical protein
MLAWATPNRRHGPGDRSLCAATPKSTSSSPPVFPTTSAEALAERWRHDDGRVRWSGVPDPARKIVRNFLRFFSLNLAGASTAGGSGGQLI